MTNQPTLDEVREQYVADDVQAVAEYRSVSKLAVTALLVGLLSAVALIPPHSLVINLLGVICAVLALARIARADRRLVGRNLALVGLALSLAFGSYAYARGAVIQHLVAGEAEQWGLDWCKLVREGRLPLALELKQPPTSRRPLNDTLAEYYSENPQGDALMKAFRENDAVMALLTAPSEAKLTPGRVQGVMSAGQGEYVVLHEFLLTSPKSPSGEPAILMLQMRRARLSRLGGGAWYLTDLAVKS